MDKKYISWALLLLAILAVSFFLYKAQDIKRMYKAKVMAGLNRNEASEPGILIENDIEHLPEPVQKYLSYVGVIGKEKVQNMRVVCEGQIKMDIDKGWAGMETQQYNFYDDLTRLYYIQGKVSGLPVIGLDSYKAEKGNMLIKVAGLFKVVDAVAPEMDKAALVTLLNDMCMMAPATLIDERIQWETIDSKTVKATLHDKGSKASALLYFNDMGELTEFVTDDRYFSPKGTSYQSVRWSTPVSDYKDFNGVRIAAYGEAIWHFPEGDFCYAKAAIKEVEYNVKSFR